MASRSSRALLVSVLLVAAIAVGYLLHPKASLAKSWSIKIGKNPCELFDDRLKKKAPLQRISKPNGDSIKWHAEGDRNFYIVLHLTVTTECKLPFAGLKDLNATDPEGRALYLIGTGPAKQADSGPVESAFTCYPDPDDPKTWIKYDQYVEVVPGVFQSCDGMIIIDP